MNSPPPKFKYREVSFHPPEADRLADKLAQVIQQVRARYEGFDSSLNFLKFNWEGSRKEHFLSEAEPHSRNIALGIEYLLSQEDYFRNITVTRMEAYINPEWAAYQQGAGQPAQGGK
jgi:uncharacterized protein YukE